MGNKSSSSSSGSHHHKKSHKSREPVPEGLGCPVCLDLFDGPVLLSCCGRSACRKCLAALTQCPLCKQALTTPADQLVVNKDLDRICKAERKRLAAPPPITKESDPKATATGSVSPSSSSGNVSGGTTLVPSAPMPPPVAPLLRQMSTGRLCVICQDTDCLTGLECHGDDPTGGNDDDNRPIVTKANAGKCETHFVCIDCFSPYVRSICTDPGKFKDCHFSIRCPYPKCPSVAWTTQEVTACLLSSSNTTQSKEVIDIFVNSLTKAADRAEKGSSTGGIDSSSSGSTGRTPE